jgi:hypothetical protein
MLAHACCHFSQWSLNIVSSFQKYRNLRKACISETIAIVLKRNLGFQKKNLFDLQLFDPSGHFYF